MLTLLLVLAARADTVGYYRFPAIAGDTIVFTAEGDLWRVGVGGGAAVRLTTHHGQELDAVLSPDGKQVAFSAEYEGPREVYLMPVDGGLPARLTWEQATSRSVGFVDGRVLVATDAFSTLPDVQLALVDPVTTRVDRIPLSQAAQGVEVPGGLVFTRLAFNGSQTKRYVGGTAENLWRFDEGADEAVPLTADYPGASRSPMWWDGRVYFASDRDGTMNLWSMNAKGGDPKQHTTHVHWDIASPALSEGRIVYQKGPDLHLFDIAAGTDTRLDIRLTSDLDQTRERFLEDPSAFLTAAAPSPTGDRVALTARGQVFVAPNGPGRFVPVTRDEGVRYREARFLPDGQNLVALSDASGELEYWRLPANGVGEPTRLTTGGNVFRMNGAVSPDGKRLAFTDKDLRLSVVEIATGRITEVPTDRLGQPWGFAWSPDSAWLAWVEEGGNQVARIWLHNVRDGRKVAATTDRVASWAPTWSPEGRWLYFLSDRKLQTKVPSPWGPMQPEPYLAETTGIYAIALHADDALFPWTPRTELQPEAPPDEEEVETKKTKRKKRGRKPETDAAEPLRVDVPGLAERLFEVPLPTADRWALEATQEALFFTQDGNLQGVKIADRDLEVVTLVPEVEGWELTADRKAILVRKAGRLYVVDAKPEPVADLEPKAIDLSAWQIAVAPRDEWRQMFVEAWRLHRDFFYDKGMHGLDWKAELDRFLPAVDRITDRAELADLLSQLVGELSALHTFVTPGDRRIGDESVVIGDLGAQLTLEPGVGQRVEHIYRSDPDQPHRASPLARPGVDVREGDLVVAVDGADATRTPLGALLRGRSGRQVRLAVRRGTQTHDVIVVPMDPWQARDLRYHEWELTRRLQVEKAGGGDLGYLHLRAMGGGDYADFAAGYYPVFDRKGLIVDVRHNNGGNIDSWILSRLMRQAWFYWSGRAGQPIWNMQYAFRGHMAVLIDEKTASDGEAFAEGFKRLGLGPAIGTRTWGGEIWLSFSNDLVDGGIASAAEWGVYGPEGEWLVEGHGVDPDVLVDNLPHATFAGRDAQLEAAIAWLQKKLVEEPVSDPAPPPGPVKTREEFQRQRR